MKPAFDISRSFSIEVQRIKSALDESKDFYWFYVRMFLQAKSGATVTLADIAFVEYHLRHQSFPNPNVRVSNAAGGFEYKFWLYGFIPVDADVVLKTGELATLPQTKLKWEVTEAELKLNGRRELSW